jgi:septum formation topological specificity factor MinE
MTPLLPVDPVVVNDRCIGLEPDLDELLADEIMEAVMRSAHIGRDQFRRHLAEIALRIRDRS